jgi:heptosyltransferase-1
VDKSKNGYRIGIVKLSSFGDILHALPVANTLKNQFKDCHITWVSEKLGSRLLENNPAIDEVVIIDTKTWRKWLKKPGMYPQLVRELRGCIHKLRSVRFDAVVDLQGLIKSGVILRLMKTEERWGFPSYRCREPLNTWFANKYISDSLLQGHIIDQNLAFTRLMGCKQPVTKLKFTCPKPEQEEIDRFLKGLPQGRKPVILNPGAGWKTKIWPVEKYTRVCEFIAKQLDVVPLLTWGPGDEPLVRAIKTGSGNVAVQAPETNLLQLAYLIRKCWFIIGGDTGPVHLAAAQEIPVVAIMGPSDPARNGPYGQKHEIVYQERECSGCYKRQCDDADCIQDIPVDDVIGAVNRIVKRFPVL